MPSRNEPCPCGSGKRYKNCHGAVAAPPLAQAPEPPSPAPAEPARVAALRDAARAARDDAAIRRWHALLAEVPGDPEAHFHLGNAARNGGDFAAAAAHYEAALAATPGHTGLLNNLGLVLEKLGRMADAERRFEEAVALAPTGLQPLANLAQNLFQQGRPADALEYFDRLVARHPQLAAASIHGNRGICLSAVGRFADAANALERAMELDPTLVSLARQRGMMLGRQRKWVEAIDVLNGAAKQDPSDIFVAGTLAHARANIADWDDDGALERTRARLRDANPAAPAFVMAVDALSQWDDFAVQRQAARGWIATPRIAAPAADPAKTRLRLGFVASAFGNHPVPRLLSGLIAALDRERAQPIAIATTTQNRRDPSVDATLARFDAAVEIKQGALTPEDLRKLQDLDIDVLFDLNGLTGDALPALFYQRVAPMHVNYLGFTGTMGSELYDYIVADSYCIPEASSREYAEKVLRIDPCYLPSDPTRMIGATGMTRARYGLPDEAFVMAMFGSTFKLARGTFAVWMATMRAHPRTVMWLRPMHEAAVANLRRSAETLGVAPHRLVFSVLERTPDYLARFRLADLVLDTYPYGSHTTTNDALFAGVPVVTVAGRTFAARASASQLATMGLHELIADDLDAYARLCDALITDPGRLAAVTGRVRADAARAALFDMQPYARKFVDAIFAGWRALAASRQDSARR